MSFEEEDDPLDSIEERPTFDVSATYMSDEEINKMYPKHPIDVSYNIVEKVYIIVTW